MNQSLRHALRAGCAVAALLAVAACGNDQGAELRESAQGEILPGSASDAMLPLDSVRSQPPLAPRVDASGKPGGGGSSAPGAADEAAAGEEAGSAAEAPAPSKPEEAAPAGP